MKIALVKEWQILDALKVVDAVVKGYKYDPGDSDLDNEQPIWVSMTLEDYRRAQGLAGWEK